MGFKELIFGGGMRGAPKQAGAHPGSVQGWLPIRDIKDGVIQTSDGRFVKVLEVLPLNFNTLSDLEKESVIADYAAFLKIAPDTVQVTVLSRNFNLDGYIAHQSALLSAEENERCREMIEDNIAEVSRVVREEAINHRFFLSFAYEQQMKARAATAEAIAQRLNEIADVVRRYLDRCGLETLEPEYSDNAILELLYEVINKHTSRRVKLPDGVFDMITTVHGVYE